MIQIENIETMNFAAAIRGMRNPMNSWAKSDTVDVTGHCNECKDFGLQCIKTTHCPVLYDVGTADLGLMRRLVAAGPEHRKFMRQIFVSMDITAPPPVLVERVRHLQGGHHGEQLQHHAQADGQTLHAGRLQH